MSKLIVLVLVAAIGMFVWSNYTTAKRMFNNSEKEVMVVQAKLLVEHTKKLIKDHDSKDNYECTGSISQTSNRNIFYFPYEDVGIINKDMYGYVKVVQTGADLSYYVYLVDSKQKLTIPETKYKDLTAEIIKRKVGTKKIPKDGLECYSK